MHGRRRTFGQGGPRQLTQAEIVEKELERSDRVAILATESITPIIDLTNSPTASLKPTASRKDLGQPAASLLQDVVPHQYPRGQHTAPKAVQQPKTPFIMTFSASGAIIRSPQRSIAPAIASTYPNSLSRDPEVTVLEV